MESEKRSEKSVRIGFGETAREAVLAAAARRAWETAETPEGGCGAAAMPDLAGAYGEKLLRPAWLRHAEELADGLGRWGDATVDDEGAELVFTAPMTDREACALGRLARRQLAAETLADVSEASGHPLAGADRRRAEEAADSLLAFAAVFGR